MDWHVIEGNWLQYKGYVSTHWHEITDEHVDDIAGKREHLIDRIQKNYGISHHEAEGQVVEWEIKNQDVFAETAAAISKLPKSLHGSTE